MQTLTFESESALRRDGDWRSKFELLYNFYRQHGHCAVPSTEKELCEWSNKQRNSWDSLGSEKKQHLLSIGFVHDVQRAQWSNKFVQLSAWHAAHGHFEIPAGFPELGQWTNLQRIRFKSGELAPAEHDALKKLGFLADCEKSSSWFAMADDLRAVCESLEESPVACPSVGAVDLGLMVWAMRVAPDVLQKDLDLVKKLSLENIDFDWESMGRSRRWGERYIELYDFWASQGHCRISRSSFPGLNSWAVRQRASKRMGKLTPAREAMLDLLGFRWASREESWGLMLEKLRDYQAKHGHCNVRLQDSQEEPTQLVNWTMTQRIQFNKGTLSSDRMKRLNDIGFVWDFKSFSWEERLQEYSRFKHGEIEATQELRVWINFQRLMWRRGKISKERIAKLSAKGFVWDPWEEKYRDLLRFERQHGHTLIPRNYCNGVLYNFVRNQRTKYRKGSLVEEKARLLIRLNLLYEEPSG